MRRATSATTSSLAVAPTTRSRAANLSMPDQCQAAHAARRGCWRGARPSASSSSVRRSRPAAVSGRGGGGYQQVLFARPRGHDQAHARLALVLPQREGHLDRQHRAVGEQRVGAQRVVAPAPLLAGGQRPAQRRMGGFLEQVHDRLAGDAVLDAVQLVPGGVGVGDDALLHLHDGVVGAVQHGVELAARVVRGLDRRIERALGAEHAQLAQHHRLQARRAGQRHHVARAERDRRRRCSGSSTARASSSTGTPGASWSRTRITGASSSGALLATCTTSSRVQLRRARRPGRAARGSRCNAPPGRHGACTLLMASTGSRATLSTMSGTAFGSVKRASTTGGRSGRF